MNEVDLAKVNILVDSRKDLFTRLKHLDMIKSYPVCSVTLYNNSGIKVAVGLDDYEFESVRLLTINFIQNKLKNIETELTTTYGITLLPLDEKYTEN